jgi:uncharacterized protein YcsI (UPF0317 family)
MTNSPDSMDRQPAQDLRQACRIGRFRAPTCGHAPGFVQANLVVLPKTLAYDFLLFCQRNPRPCPLIEVTEPGEADPRGVAVGADLRTDLPLYRIYRDGRLEGEVADLQSLWRADFVSFLLGCSFTFEQALLAAGLGVRHLEETNADGQPKNVPMYRTNIPCRSAGVFSGPMVVSMRPYSPREAIEATRITARYPRAHGTPIHLGDPSAIGVADVDKPDWGDAVTIQPGEIPVFWACGVTPQAAILQSKPEIAITHAPGHMFVCDMKDEELADG